MKRSQTDMYVEQIRRDGYCVIENMIGADDVGRVRDDAMAVPDLEHRVRAFHDRPHSWQGRSDRCKWSIEVRGGAASGRTLQILTSR